MVKKIWASLAAILIVLSTMVGVFSATTVTTHAEATDPVLTKIKKRGELIVGTSADYAPYEFHSTATGKDKIVGFDIAIAQKIADKLGVKLVVKDMNFDSLLGSIKTGKIDMILAGMTLTKEREQQVLFSKAYFYDKNVIMVRASDKKKLTSEADFNGKKIAAQLTTTQEEAAKAIKGVKVVSLKKVIDATTQLSEGKVDGVVVPQTTADTYEMQSKQFATSSAKLSTADAEIAHIAMPKNATVLHSKVNTIIDNDVKGKNLEKWRKEAAALTFKKESFFHKYGPYFIKGTGYTVGLAIIGVLFGAVLGAVFALMKLAKFKPFNWISNIYIEFVRGTPLLIQVFIVYFGTQVLGLDVSGFVSGAIAMSLNSAAYVAEIIRSGINSVADGQHEAARSLGLSKGQTMRYVIMSQAIKNILPALGNEFVTVIKEGSVVSVIGVGELTFQTSVVQGASFMPFIPLMITAAIYFVLTFTLSRLLALYEKKLGQSNRQA